MDSADFDHRDDEDAQSFHTATSSSSGYNEEDTAAGLSYRAGAGAGANDEAGNNEETSVSGMATAAGEGHSSNNSETTAQTAKEGHQQDDDYESSSCEEDQNDVFRDAGEAKEQKQKGNECFKNKEYENAITLYTNAIALCPRTEEEKPSRAIFHCNRAACYAGIEEYEASLKDCNKAIKLNEKYVKAYLRRATANEKLDKLEDALQDHKKVLELDPKYYPSIAAKQQLEKQIEDKNEKMKEEMMGKLKDLGNMFLGKFGLSTDNFQMQQDPNSGGYSVNFVQQPHKDEKSQQS